MRLLIGLMVLSHVVTGTEISRSVVTNGGDGVASSHHNLTAALGEGLVGSSTSAHHEIVWGFFAFVGEPCAMSAVCEDRDVCTYNVCENTLCAYKQVRFGDVNGSGATGASPIPDLDDILCVIAGFGDPASCLNGDVAPTTGPNACQGDGLINLDDLLAVLAAFAGDDPCECAG